MHGELQKIEFHLVHDLIHRDVDERVGMVRAFSWIREFYYIPWRTQVERGEEYRTVDLPDEEHADWMAPQGPDFGLFEVLAGSSWVPSAGVARVGPELVCLLRSACRCPPALALAREGLSRLILAVRLWSATSRPPHRHPIWRDPAHRFLRPRPDRHRPGVPTPLFR